jgi:hypothetical protein
MLIRGLDLREGASGATLGLYIKAPETTTMAPPSEDSARSHWDGMLNPCRKGGSAALRVHGPSWVKWLIENGQSSDARRKENGRDYRPPSSPPRLDSRAPTAFCFDVPLGFAV